MIQLKDASFTYPFHLKPAVREVDLEVAPGEIVLLTGPSGCGKSTVIRMINGLALRHFQGTLTGQVQVEGRLVNQQEMAEISTRVGTLFQNPESQFFALNVEDEIAMGHEWRQVPIQKTEQNVQRAADRFDIGHLLDQSIFSLSEGQKQKVALASIMSLGPRALVLDEPTANLDPESMASLALTLAELKDLGVAILVVDHRLYWLRHLADRVAIMNQGEIVAQGPFSILDDDLLRQRHGLRKSRVVDPRPELSPPPVNTDHTIQLRNLCFAHERHNPLFTDAMLDLPMGKVVGLLGPNGAGKTTLVMLLTGLLKAAQGRLILDGHNLKPTELLRMSSVILQNTGHQLHMQTVLDEVAAALPRETKAKQETRALELLIKYDIVHLALRHPQSLSGGEKQRLVIACGEAKEPDVFIMDEPTSGLDGTNMRLIADRARNFAKRGACVLLISHDLELLGISCHYGLALPLQPSTPKEYFHDFTNS